MPQNIEDAVTPIEQRVLGVLISFAQRGILGPSLALLAALARRSIRTVQRVLRSLEKKGLLETIARRISANRNDTNLYKLIGLGFKRGVGDKTSAVIREKALKTTTPALKRGLEKSVEALTSELRRVRDVADHWRKQFEYAEAGNLWAKHKEWRTGKRAVAEKLAVEAAIGVYRGPVTEESPEDVAWREEYRRKNGLG
jgi:DNA-binding transcriptional regulator YhcF (GntR family)